MKTKNESDATLQQAMEQITTTDSLQYVVIDDGFPDSLDKMSFKKMDELKEKVVFHCRFHPTDGFHEVGCSHLDWTKEELIDAIKMAKVTHEVLVKQLSKYAAFEKGNPEGP
jgi:hypothetical protein